jgi:hypothetical protein
VSHLGGRLVSERRTHSTATGPVSPFTWPGFYYGCVRAGPIRGCGRAQSIRGRILGEPIEKGPVYAASRINQLRKSSSAASHLRAASAKVTLSTIFGDVPSPKMPGSNYPSQTLRVVPTRNLPLIS